MNINEASIFETLESEVRSYCRDWPAVFTSASGSWIRDENGREYLDFFAGAGALNYGQALAMSTILMGVCAGAMLALEKLRFGDVREF